MKVAEFKAIYPGVEIQPSRVQVPGIPVWILHVECVLWRRFLKGERIHPCGWSGRGGSYRKKYGSIFHLEQLAKHLGIGVITGNDAPRNGWAGNWIEMDYRTSSVVNAPYEAVEECSDGLRWMGSFYRGRTADECVKILTAARGDSLGYTYRIYKFEDDAYHDTGKRVVIGVGVSG